MQKWVPDFSKQERPLYTLEQENQLLHDMVLKISVERNTYRIENQRLMDEVARLRREVGDKHE